MDACADLPVDRTALPPGTRLGEMEIVRTLAVGGFGIVYLARDHSLDRDVAIKEFMPAQLAARSQGQRVTVRSISGAETYAMALRSFVNEAKLLARFTHPAMVKVYRFWEANGTAYMVMPHLRGPTLADVRRSMSAPPTEVWLRSVIDPLLDALAMLHSEGCFHRDVAPDNILVTGAGLPVLLDFGAARRLIGDRTQSVTAILKPRYAPIEQYAEATQLRQGPWTDLYALAAVVAYLLDGVPPPASTARAIHDDMGVLARRRIPGVSRRFLAAIDWALAVRPQDRPQNVAELRAALAGRLTPPQPVRPRAPALQGEAAAPFPTTLRLDRPAPLPAHATTAASSGRRFALAARLVAAAGVLVAVVMAWPFMHQPRADAVVALSAPATTSPAVTMDAATSLAPMVSAGYDPPAVTSREEAAPGVIAVVDPIAPRAVQPASIHRAAKGTRTRPALVAKLQQRSVPKPAHDRKFAAAQTPPTGPIEMCAGRNFFIRPYCIQRLCDEPRFKVHSQCVHARQVARYRD